MQVRFVADHVRIRAIAAELTGYLRAPAAPVELRFARCRWELIRELATHLACERRALAGVRATVPDMALDEALRSHIREWTGATIQYRWPDYRRAVRSLLSRLDTRMKREERDLLPLLG